MNIRENEDGPYSVYLTDEEMLLMSSIIGHSYSGGDWWRVLPEDYEGKFGITYERGKKMCSLMRAQWKERRSDVPIVLTKTELHAVVKIIEHIMEKLDENDFPTLINGTSRPEAAVLLEQFQKAGF